MRRSGLALMLVGLVSIAFFILTDPRILGGQATTVGWSGNSVDAAFDATVGTLLGLAGSAVTIIIGLWLLTRREI